MKEYIIGRLYQMQGQKMNSKLAFVKVETLISRQLSVIINLAGHTMQ